MKILYFFLTSLLLQSFPTIAQQYPQGEVIPKVVCSADTSETYALYLPTAYDKNQSPPILYIFEPMGRAVLGVQVFQKAAEKYGYILACPFNSRNGPMDPIIAAFNAISEDINSKFTLDAKRIYMAGFSGGARVATTFAMESRAVAGVIACGAGFPDGIPPKKHYDFLLIGLVGNTDMNFLEMYELKDKLEELKFREELLIFEGGHQWADTSTVEMAFQWLELQEMKAKKVALNETIIKDFTHQNEQKIANASNDFERYQYTKILVNTLKDLTETNDFEEELQTLAAMKEMKTRQEQRKQALKEETPLQEKFVKEFLAINSSPFKGDSTLKNEAWWKREIRQLNKTLAESVNVEEKWMAARVLDFVWRNAYIQHTQYNHATASAIDLKLAGKYLEIWSYVQENIPAPLYLLAKIYARLDNVKKSIKTLEEAIEKGFKNWDYLKQDADFDAIREEKKFKELLKGK
ncbi:MAG: hypothetical protein R3E32_09590 [Chitinophagales bacterium]